MIRIEPNHLPKAEDDFFRSLPRRKLPESGGSIRAFPSMR